MDDKTNTQEILKRNSDIAFQSPITELELPPSVHNLLEKNDYQNIGDLILQMESDEKQVLALRGIGPKILEQIGVALKKFKIPNSTPEVKSPSYPSPVPSLADYYKPPLGNMVSSQESDDVSEEPQDGIPSYSPPVPSLADYFDPDGVITSVSPMKTNLDTVVKKNKSPKKKAKGKWVEKIKKGSKGKKNTKKANNKNKSKKMVTKSKKKKKSKGKKKK